MALPTGIILIWSGALVDIPLGYVVCDGNNDTPDLRTMFVRGAGGGLNPDDTGGQNAHTHTFTSNTHFHTTAPGASLAAGVAASGVTTSNAVTGTTDQAVNLPVYYALFYIMKT